MDPTPKPPTPTPPAVPPATPSAPPAQPAAAAPLRVLCIEDEHFIGELYARAMAKAGYDFTVMVDGAKGLQEAKTNQYDIILLDLMVPNMSGFDILKTLRDPSLQPPVKAKIIITTNLEQKEEMREALEAQADGYIIKAEVTPNQMVRLLSTIK